MSIILSCGVSALTLKLYEFLVRFLGFSMQMFMLSANSSCTSFPICIPFFFGCTALARTFSAYVLSCFSCV